MVEQNAPKSTPKPQHDCGLCDAPITFDGMVSGYATWQCSFCDWWHISKDCCSGGAA